MAVLGDMMEMESSRDKDEEGREREEKDVVATASCLLLRYF